MSGELVSTRAGDLTRTEHAERIASAWQSSVQSIIETGRLLTEAKADLEHGLSTAMVGEDLPFGPRAARMLMAVGNSPCITNRKHASVLPPSWMTLYELTKLSDDVFQARIADGTIHPEMQRKDVAPESRQKKKVEDEERIREPEHGQPPCCALQGVHRKYAPGRWRCQGAAPRQCQGWGARSGAGSRVGIPALATR